MDNISQSNLTNFFSKYKRIHYKKGEVIIRGDDEPTGVFFIISGHVKMGSILENGTEIVMNIFKPNSYLPMVWAIGGVSNSYYYRALTPTEVYKSPKNDFLDFLKINPEILLDLTSRILVGLDGVLYTTKHMLNSNSLKRVAIAIAMLSRRFGTKKDNGEIEINLQFTHQDIANISGLTRETVSICVEKLRIKNILLKGSRNIVIKNLQALESI